VEGFKMSHYTQVRTQLKRKDCIVSALTSLGFTDLMVSEENSITLRNYYGMRTKRTAQIVLERGYGRHADVGFELKADGTYTLHCDSMDGFASKTWIDKFTQQYEKQVILEEIEARGFYLEEELVDGQDIVLVATSPF
jgi:hypothetical protein